MVSDAYIVFMRCLYVSKTSGHSCMCVRSASVPVVVNSVGAGAAGAGAGAAADAGAGAMSASTSAASPVSKLRDTAKLKASSE